MLTIQLLNGKTAEFSVRDFLYLRTPNQTYVVSPATKDDIAKNENAKSVVTNISIDRYQTVHLYRSTSTNECLAKFIEILGELEAATGPKRIDEMGEPDLDKLNSKW